MIKPGVTWRDVSVHALELTARQLMLLNIITNKKEVHKYFPHAIGHFLGLDVHDAGDYTKPLAENMVITVEPGIYIPEMSIGVRFEDDILVTKTGAKVL
jgi:Xaa-Pro aminopeptidase